MAIKPSWWKPRSEYRVHRGGFHLSGLRQGAHSLAAVLEAAHGLVGKPVKARMAARFADLAAGKNSFVLGDYVLTAGGPEKPEGIITIDIRNDADVKARFDLGINPDWGRRYAFRSREEFEAVLTDRALDHFTREMGQTPSRADSRLSALTRLFLATIERDVRREQREGNDPTWFNVRSFFSIFCRLAMMRGNDFAHDLHDWRENWVYLTSYDKGLTFELYDLSYFGDSAVGTAICEDLDMSRTLRWTQFVRRSEAGAGGAILSLAVTKMLGAVREFLLQNGTLKDDFVPSRLSQELTKTNPHQLITLPCHHPRFGEVHLSFRLANSYDREDGLAYSFVPESGTIATVVPTNGIGQFELQVNLTRNHPTYSGFEAAIGRWSDAAAVAEVMKFSDALHAAVQL